ncbi:MAG: hypothetical protein Q8M29_03370 [Bacteroidota bacterium]|nr:hypothetical protein [Bacteroidota bacterium]
MQHLSFITLSNSTQNNRFAISLVEESYYELKIFAGVDIDIDDVKDIVAAQKQMGGKRLPTLVNAPPDAIVNVETMNYISKNENFPYSKAGAYLVSSSTQKLLSNFYLKLKNPQRPTKFFSNREEAVKWIMEQKDL